MTYEQAASFVRYAARVVNMESSDIAKTVISSAVHFSV